MSKERVVRLDLIAQKIIVELAKWDVLDLENDTGDKVNEVKIRKGKVKVQVSNKNDYAYVQNTE